MAKGSLIARIRCEIEIHVGTWGDDAILGQLAEQVRREGANKVRHLIAGNQGKVIGEPKVVFVRAEEE